MARSATIQLAVEAGSARAELESLEGGLEDLNIAAVEVGEGFERVGPKAAQGLQQAETQMRRTADAGVTMRSSVRASANNLGFEFVQAAQDAQFGMQGVVNQVPLMVEQFGQLQSKTGSTSGAASALATSLAGPAGVAAGIFAVVQFGPQLVGMLTDSAGEMRVLGAATKEAEDDLRTFVNTSRDLQELPQQLSKVGTQAREELNSFDIESGFTLFRGEFSSAVAGATDRRLTDARDDIRQVRELLRGTGVEARTLRAALRSAGVDVSTILEGSFATAGEEIRRSEEALRSWNRNLEAYLETPEAFVNETLRQFQRFTERQRGLLEVGRIDQEEFLQRRRDFLQEQIDLVQEGSPFDIRQDEFDPILSFYESLGGELENIKGEQEEIQSAPEVDFITIGDGEVSKAERLKRIAETFPDRTPIQFSPAPLPDRESPGGGSFDQLAGLLGEAQRAEQFGFSDAAAGRAETLRQRAREAMIQGQITERQFHALMRAADRFETASTDALDATALGAQVATSAMSGLTQALAQGESLAKGLQQTVTQLLTQIGGTFLQKAIQGGTALGLGGGPLAALGIGGSLFGGLIGSFERGGTVPGTGMIRAHPPELAVGASGGTQIIGREETEAILAQAQGAAQSVRVQLEGTVIPLGPREIGVAVRESQKRRSRHQ